MNSGIAHSVANLLGKSRIPASAVPITEPTDPRRDTRKRDRKVDPEKARDGRARIIAALDKSTSRSVDELARMAGVSKFTVYGHIPALLEAGIAVEEKTLGHRAAKRYLRGRG